MKKFLLICFLAAQVFSMQAHALIESDNSGRPPSGFIPYDFNQARLARQKSSDSIRNNEQIRRSVAYQRERFRQMSRPKLKEQNILLMRELNSTRNLK